MLAKFIDSIRQVNYLTFRILPAVLACLVFPGQQSVFGQQRGFMQVNQDVEVSSLIEAPRELQRLLDEVDSAIEQKQWGEATQGLGILLGIEPQVGSRQVSSQDFFLFEGEGKNKTQRSLRAAVLNRFRDLPEDGNKVLELRFGVTARQLLDQAAEKQDWFAIQKIVRDFVFTAAGRDAAWIVAEHRIEQGELEAALFLLTDLLESPTARAQFGPALGVLAAASAKGAGQESKAQALLTISMKHWPEKPLTWNSKPLSIGADGLASTADLDLKTIKTASRYLEAWPLIGGRADRNGESNVSMPSMLLSWDAKLHDSLQSEEGVLEVMRRKLNEEATIMPARVPLICNPRVIVQTYDQRVVAINLKNGRLDWHSPYSGLPVTLPRTRILGRQVGSTEPSVQSYLLSRVWGESSTGQMSADADRLYVVSDVSALEAAENLVLDSQVTRTTRQEPFNVLRSWSLASEGKLLWEVGGETGLGDSKLSGVLFLGPPTPYEGELLVLGELNGEVILFGLEPTSGRQLWSQQLVANNSSPISVEPKRRNLACSPSVSGGVAMCPTLSGYLVAFDLGTRTLRWASKYGDTRRLNPRANAFGYNQPEPFDPFSPRSVNNSVVIADGCAIHAPSDADSIYAVDVQTGETLWSMNRGEWRYIGGVYKNIVLIVGERELMACNTRTGDSAWTKEKVELSTGDRVAGIGVRNRNRFYLPLTSQQIVEINIETGEEVGRTRVEGPVGNLASDGNLLISCSPFDLSAYIIRDRLKSSIGPDFESQPDSLDARSRAAIATILLSEGKIEAALQQAIQAYRKDPKDFDVQMLLQKTCLEALRDNFDKYIGIVSEFDSLMAISPNRRLYFLGMVDGFVKKGDFVRAFSELLKFSEDKNAEKQRTVTGANLVQWRENWSIDIDRWTLVTAQRIFEKANEEQRQAMVKLAKPRMDAATRLSAFPQDFVNVFGFLPGSEELRFRYAESLLETGKTLEAERLLLILADQQAAPLIARQAAVTLTRLYRMSGRPTAAVLAADKYGISDLSVSDDEFVREDDFPRIELDPFERPDFNSRGQLPENARQLMRGLDQWPKGKVETDELPPSDGRDLYVNGTGFCPMIHCGGDALKDWIGQTALQGFLFSGPMGMEHIFCQVEKTRGGINSAIVRTLDSLILIELAGELVAVDSLHDGSDKEILWRQSFDEGGTFSPNRNSNLRGEKDRWGREMIKPNRGFTILGLTRAALVVGMRDQIVAFDPISGDRLWMRSGISRNVAGSVDGNRLAVLDASLGKRTILDIRDGSIIEESPWQGELNVLATNGANMLLDVGIQDALRPGKVQLLDVQQSKTLLEREFPKRSVAEISANNFFVVWQPDGKIYTWDLTSGKEYVYEGQPSKHPLDKLRLMQFENRLVLLPFGSLYAVDALLTLKAPQQYIDVSGPIMALNTEDGQPAWSEPIEALRVGIPSNLSRRTPALVMLRRVMWRPEKSASSESILSMYVVDVRTGKLVYHSDNMGRTLSDSPFSFVANLDSNSIDVGAVGRQVRLSWTDQPSTVQPPGKIGCLTRDELETWLKTQPERNIEDSQVPGDR